MTSQEAQIVLDEAACLGCALSPFQLLQVQAVLLWRQLNPDTPMTSDDVQATLSDASCLGCRTPWQVQLVIAELLWEILEGGGGGGGGSISQLPGPVSGWAAPTNPASTSLQWNSTDGILYVWNVDSQAWEPVGGGG